MSRHTFAIDHITNPETGEAFGARFAGDFTVRRPTIRDNANIAIAFGKATQGVEVNPMVLASPDINSLYICCFVNAIAEEKPEWFNEEMFEEDIPAVLAVWQEIDNWRSQFRPKASAKAGVENGANPSVLVQTEVPANT